jgi:hypothetical protein
MDHRVVGCGSCYEVHAVENSAFGRLRPPAKVGVYGEWASNGVLFLHVVVCLMVAVLVDV